MKLFVEQKGSLDVKSYLWNHLDKKVLLWHREAPLFLRVYGASTPPSSLIATEDPEQIDRVQLSLLRATHLMGFIKEDVKVFISRLSAH